MKGFTSFIGCTDALPWVVFPHQLVYSFVHLHVQLSFSRPPSALPPTEMEHNSRAPRPSPLISSSSLVSLSSLILVCTFYPVNALHHMKRAPYQYVSQRDETRPLTITNQCSEVIYPGIATQAGTAPSVQGFSLDQGETRELTVGADWQGRVWGRTNCSFNSVGSGPSNAGGNNGGGSACTTGDCNGVVDCVVTVCSICFPAFHNKRAKGFDRAIRRLPLQSSLFHRPLLRPTTISLLLTDTTYPLASSRCTPPQEMHH